MKISALVLFAFITSNIQAQVSNKATIKKYPNGIQLKTVGKVKVKEAQLYYDATSEPVADSNVVNLGEKVILFLQLEPNGWVQKDSIVSVGGSEIIKTNTGATVLKSDDLYAGLTNIKATDAEYISLKAVITEMKKDFPYFNVSFMVWDKWGTSKIIGSYKLRVKR